MTAQTTFAPISTALAQRVGIAPTDELPTFADGGYPLYYLDGQNSVLCPACANNSRGDDTSAAFQPIAGDVNWEDPDLFCDDCGAHIHSAYGDDE